MKAIKRTVAALLATLMLATSTSFTLAAENYTDDEAVVVAKVNAAGIMTGTDKGFEPSKSLTRAEAAAIIVRMKGISESAVKTMAGTTLFNDVAASHWASGYVNEASNLGIVKGVSAKEFAPDREVTVAEFVTMAVRALGAGQLVDSEGVWPTNYVNFANDNDLLKDVTAIYTATASRMNAATIVANTLEATMWEKSGVKSNGEITWTKNADEKSILSAVLKLDVYKGATFTTINTKDRELTGSFATLNGKKEATPTFSGLDVADGVDMASLKSGMSYDFWYDKDDKEITGIWEAENVKISTVAFDEITKVTNKEITVVIDGKEKTYDLVARTSTVTGSKINVNSQKAADEVEFDGTAATLTGKYSNKENVFGTIILDGSKVKTIYLEEYKFAGIVDEVTKTRVKFEAPDDKASVYGNAKDFKLDDDSYIYNIVKDGKVIKAEDLEEDDVVFYYAKADETNVYNVLVSTNKVEGKITSISSTDKYIKLDGKKYNYLAGCTYTVDDEIEAYLNAAGKIVMSFDIESEGKYAYVSSVEAINGRKGVDFEVVLTLEDGTKTSTLKVDLEESGKKANLGAAGAADLTEDEVRKLVVGTADYTTGTQYTAGDATKGTVSAANLAIAAGRNTNKTGILGTVVEYEIDGSDLVIKSLTNEIASLSGSLNVGSRTYVLASSVKYYITDSTKLLVAKTDSKAYKMKASVITLDELDTDSAVVAIYGGINSDNELDFVVFDDSTITKASTTDGVYGIVIAKEGNGEDSDYDFTYTVLFNDGTFDDYLSDKTLTVGTQMYEFTIANGVITDMDATAHVSGTTAGFDTYSVVSGNTLLYVEEKNGVIYFYEGKDVTVAALTAPVEKGNVELVSSKGVAYVTRENVGTAGTPVYSYGIGSEADIDELTLSDLYSATSELVNTNTVTTLPTDVSNIAAVYFYTTKDDVQEVVAIVYDIVK